MNEPWFNPNLYAWIPGTLLGVLGGTWGALVGTLAPRGKAKGLVVGGLFLLLLASVACLVAERSASFPTAATASTAASTSWVNETATGIRFLSRAPSREGIAADAARRYYPH